jgi:hypothetical protein
MDAYDRCTNLELKNLADIIAIYGRGRVLFRPPMYNKQDICLRKRNMPVSAAARLLGLRVESRRNMDVCLL